MSHPNPGDSIQIERHGDIAVIVTAPEIEDMPETYIEQAAQMVLGPLRANPPGGIIVDLSQVNFVGSVFLSFLLRCHKIVRSQGSEMVLAGLSPKTRELLRVTALDTIWALYDTRVAALEALGAY
ncbi:MAG: STAS domain-containing protein [Gemmataceae bacterium]|nr:STAS domain-containing protein [Gemmataceae bacterium]